MNGENGMAVRVMALVYFAAVFLAWAFAISVVLSIPLMLFWNWLMPEIFGLPEVSLFQAWGLSVLSSLLFKSQSQ